MNDKDIFAVLREDHQKQRTLIDLVEKTHGASRGREELFARLRAEVVEHAAVEERVFYSILLADEKTREKAGHSVLEHREGEAIFEELTEKEFDDTGWLNRFRTLADALRHHLDEEEREMFQLAGKALTEEQKQALAKEFREERESASTPAG